MNYYAGNPDESDANWDGALGAAGLGAAGSFAGQTVVALPTAVTGGLAKAAKTLLTMDSGVSTASLASLGTSVGTGIGAPIVADKLGSITSPEWERNSDQSLLSPLSWPGELDQATARYWVAPADFG